MRDTPHESNQHIMLDATRKIELTATQLEEWFHRIEPPNQAGSGSQLLNQFGLKTPGDVIDFLKSPEGSRAQATVARQWAMMISQREMRYAQLIQLEDKQIRQLVFLLLGLAHHKARAHDYIEHMAQTANRKKSQSGQSSATLNETQKNYIEASKVLQEQLNLIEEKTVQLNKNKIKLEKQAVVMDEKYNLMENRLELLKQQIDTLSVKQLDKFIQDLDDKIEATSELIDHAIKDSRDEDATVLMGEVHACILQKLMLEDQRKILTQPNQEMTMYDDQHNPTKSLKDAAYTLSAKEKLVEKDGKIYLLNSNQDINALSPAELEQANKKYQREKANIMTSSAIVRDNKNLEKRDLNERTDELNAQNLLLRKEMLNLLGLQASLHAESEKLMQEQTDGEGLPERATPSPTLKPIPSTVTNKANAVVSKQLTQSKQRCNEAYNKIMASVPDVEQFKKNFSDDFSQLNQLRSGVPIPFQTMQGLLKNMERWGVDATKDNVATSQVSNNYLEQHREAIHKPSQPLTQKEHAKDDAAAHQQFSNKLQQLQDSKVTFEPKPKPEPKTEVEEKPVFNPKPNPYSTR